MGTAMSPDSPGERSEEGRSKRPWGKYLLWTAGIIAVIWGATMLVFGFLLWRRSEAMNPPRAGALLHLVAQQEQFKDRDLDGDGIKNYGTILELERHRLIDNSYRGRSFGFFQLWISPERDRWAALITPAHPFQGASIWVDQSGRLLLSKEIPAPKLDSSAPPPGFVPYEGETKRP